jgi:hypothetical protein
MDRLVAMLAATLGLMLGVTPAAMAHFHLRRRT